MEVFMSAKAKKTQEYFEIEDQNVTHIYCGDKNDIENAEEVDLSVLLKKLNDALELLV
jgi:hypothetical protein